MFNIRVLRFKTTMRSLASLQLKRRLFKQHNLCESWHHRVEILPTWKCRDRKNGRMFDNGRLCGQRQKQDNLQRRLGKENMCSSGTMFIHMWRERGLHWWSQMCRSSSVQIWGHWYIRQMGSGGGSHLAYVSTIPIMCFRFHFHFHFLLFFIFPTFTLPGLYRWSQMCGSSSVQVQQWL